ncbi:MAG: amidohydrolase family protein [Steroidobacteraceae bacterium]
MSYSLVIRNAQIVDGTGRPAFAGDVGVQGDRIKSVGSVTSPNGARVIDAKGNVLAPGFIDIHTHYDPQLCWDRYATPTPEHGVTSIIMGNCSVTLAPVRRGDRQRVIHLFGSVEDMEGRLLEETVPFSWESFEEYLGYLKQGLGPNVGTFVGHAVLRFYVMGEAAQQRAATDAEIATMGEVLRGALRAGAFGVSFTFNHLDEQGQALPCSYADRREKLALMRIMAEEGRGMVEVAPNLLQPDVALADIDEFGALALETGVTCSLSPTLQSPSNWRGLLRRYEEWRERGAPIFTQTQTRPLDMTTRLDQGSASLAKLPTWRGVMDKALPERRRLFSDRSLRQQLEAEMIAQRSIHRVWEATSVKRAGAVANQRYIGQLLRDISEQEGRTLTDVLLDIALADELKTEFALIGYVHADVQAVAMLLDNPAVHVGSADAGAHITQFSGAGDTCYLFQKFVREEKLMSLERAVQRLTGDLARDWCITDRGFIAEGKFADLVLFDPDTIARGEERWVEDIPGGSGRYVRDAQGVECVIVNGEVLVERGRYAPVKPGRIVSCDHRPAGG